MGALLGISSRERMAQVKEILQAFWEEEKREKKKWRLGKVEKERGDSEIFNFQLIMIEMGRQKGERGQCSFLI